MKRQPSFNCKFSAKSGVIRLLTGLLAGVLCSASFNLLAAPVSVDAASPGLADQARAVANGDGLTITGLNLQAEGAVTLELERFSVFAPDAFVEVVSDRGTTVMSPPDTAYFRGWANHDPNSIVYFAVTADGKMRGIVTGSSGVWMMQSHSRYGVDLANRKVDFKSELKGETFSCGDEPSTVVSPMEFGDGSIPGGFEGGIPTNVTATAHIIVDTDFEYLQEFGGDPGDALEYMGDLFAYSSAVYEREIDTNLLISQARLFSTNHDPYELMNAGCGQEGSLDELQDEWSGNATPRTVVHLLSGKNVGQGCAYVGVLCHQSDGYGSSMGIDAGAFNIDDPQVVWENMVVAHELGHNFNSPHTHNYCNIAGIADPVDNCVEAAPHPDDVGDSCYNIGAPELPGPGSLTGGSAGAGNGTIMSYCHFRSGGFGNFSWTFGEFHPDGVAPFRVSDRMRAHVAANTSCMSLQYTGPDLAIFKDCKPDDPALVGDTGICTIVVENQGTEIALGVVTEDLFVSNGTFTFGDITATKGDDPMDPGTCVASPNPQDTAGDVSCDLGELAAGHAVTIRIEVEADGPQNVNDRVTVSSDSPDPNSSNNMAEDTLTFIESADLGVTKLCKPDGDLLAGDTGECTIVVTNFGPSDAENVSVVDTHVSNESFTIDSVSPAGPCGINGAVVECDFSSIDAGDDRTIVINISEDEPMDINNTVSVTSDTSDPDFSNNTASDGLHIVGVADLSITKTDSPDPVVAGENLTYTIQVHNAGPSTAENVVVEDSLPANVSVVTAPAYCGAGDPMVCNLGNLGDGAVRNFDIVVAVAPDATGSIHNTASVSSDTLDSDTSNNQATATTGIIVVTDLSDLTKMDDHDPVLAGAELRYLLSVSNQGPSTATNVTLTDTLPAETTLVDYKVLGGTDDCIQSASDPDVVLCTLGDMGPGESFILTITVKVDPATPHGTTITNHAVVSQDTGADQEVWEDTLVETAADLWIDKTASFITQNPSANIIYTLTVRNDSGCSQHDPDVCGEGGPSDAQNVVVVDTLPATRQKLVVVYVSENCTYDQGSHSVTCTTDTLKAGEVVIHEIEADPRGRLRAITNVADVTSDTADPDGGNNSDSATLVVGGGGQKGTGE